MKVDAASLLKALPGPSSEKWPNGERFAKGMAHGSMSVELYAPIGHDAQSPHSQDELYVVISGTGILRIGDIEHPFSPHTCLFVPAGAPHRFEQFTADFATWVIFYGPHGGEGQVSQ